MRSAPLIALTVLVIVLSLMMFISINILKTSEILTDAYNPATVKVAIPLGQIPNLYINILAMIASKDYENSIFTLNYIEQSPIMRLSVFNYLNIEMELLISNLELLNNQANEAMYYLKNYNINESKALASSLMGNAQYTAAVLSSIRNRLSSLICFLAMLGYLNKSSTIIIPIISELTPGELCQFLPMNLVLNQTATVIYNELENYSNESLYILRLTEFLSTRNLTTTRIIVYQNNYIALVGSNITISGRLIMFNGTGIDNATIFIYYDGQRQPLINITTGPDGYFTTNLTLPLVYTDEIKITLQYAPSSSSQYMSSSAIILVRLLYTNTTYLVVMPSNVTWGEPLNISGWVNGPSGRVVNIVIGGHVYSVLTSNGGYFNASISTLNLNPGIQQILIVVEPKGPYAPARFTGYTVINTLQPTLNIKLRSYTLIAGFPFKIYGFINVNKTASSPWTVITIIGNVEHMIKINNASFYEELTPPITMLMGYYNITVILMPNPPYSGYTVILNVFVINPLELIVVISIFIVALIALVTKLPTTKTNRIEKIPEALSSPDVKLLISELKDIRSKLKGKETLLIYDMYNDVLNQLLTKHKLRITGSMTLREILSILKQYMRDDHYKILTQATLNIEKIIYANYEPSKEDIEEIMRLRSIIGEKL